MHNRETIIGEFWKRLSSVSGVNRTSRNPSAPPALSDFPVIQFFELDDVITKISNRGGYPIYTRKLTVVIEPYITASEEALSSKELGTFIQNIKNRIYAGGDNLGKKCSLIVETGSSNTIRPPVGENSVGMQIQFEILYIEDISKLY